MPPLPRIRILLFIAAALVWSSCSNYPPSNPTEPAIPQMTLIYPKSITNQTIFPLICADTAIQPRSAGKEWFQIYSSEAAFAGKPLKVKRGWGSVSDRIIGNGPRELSIISPGGKTLLEISVVVEAAPVIRPLSGLLSDENLLWDSTAVIRVTGDLTIPEGSTLHIEPGARIEIHPLVNIYARGSIHCKGDFDNPVLFGAAPLGGAGWGCIYHYSAEYDYQYAIFISGGADESRRFGHSNSQPTLGGDGSRVSFNHVFILDNPGKAFGFANSHVEIRRSLINRCDTGGEFHTSQVIIEDCYFMDMPADDGIEVDDDNDALYLAGATGNLDTSLVKNTVFITGKDDAIDHNGAIVRIVGCLIEGYDNEGVAASNQNWCEVSNTLILNCEQGIEAGYGQPTVIVKHCTLVGNQTGLRLGDWYYQNCLGEIIATDVISYGNYLHNVWNWDLSLGGPRPRAITIGYSLVNTAEFDTCAGGLVGIPRFNSDWTLGLQSPGKSAGSDGRDLGIYAVGN
ncbi:MAG: right-handed parallel beta-helix repeat-containing protein [Calditrichota bacterium]